MRRMQELRVKEEAGRRQRLTAGELSVDIALKESAYISAEADREKLSQKARERHSVHLGGPQLGPAMDDLAVAACLAPPTQALLLHSECKFHS
jgi:hypothetical protein